MPYVNISTPPNHANKNTGSSSDLVDYLEKENVGKEIIDKEFFFNQTEGNIFPEEVTKAIDGNKKGLKNSETKFYEMSVSFSQKEINHIKAQYQKPLEQKEAIQGHIRNVMDEYAKNFNRSIDGRPLEGKDLVYFAKVEYERRYHSESKQPEIKEAYKHNFNVSKKIRDLEKSGGNTNDVAMLKATYKSDREGTIILPGNLKPGDNTHVHVVISRRDKSQKISLSPLANSKGSKNKLNGKEVKIGFNRDVFAEKVEQSFDKSFNFNRNQQDKYRHRQQAKSIGSNAMMVAHSIDSPDKFVKNYATKLVKKTINKHISEYLRSKGKGHLVKPLQMLISSNRSNLVNLAASQLSNSFKTKAGVQMLATAIPTPIAAVVKAIMIAKSILEDKTKQPSKSNAIER